MLWTSLGTSASASALRSPPITNRARTTPGSDPLPPKMLTPPSRTAVITSSSKPSALSARALANRLFTIEGVAVV
jgi:hypothetical protein